jgi:hypothetical protein
LSIEHHEQAPSSQGNGPDQKAQNMIDSISAGRIAPVEPIALKT